MLPQEAGQLHAVVPAQLDVQQQQLVGVRGLSQPFHQRLGGVEHLHVVIPSPDTLLLSRTWQTAALFCSAVCGSSSHTAILYMARPPFLW